MTKKMHPSFLPFLALFFASCNHAGKKVADMPVSDAFINSSTPLLLKKGEKIELWYTVTGNARAQKPLLSVAYQVLRDNKPLLFQRATIHANDAPRINSSYETEGKNRQVEADYRVAVIPVEADGSYTVDSKILQQETAETDEDSFPMFNRDQQALLVIRK